MLLVEADLDDRHTDWRRPEPASIRPADKIGVIFPAPSIPAGKQPHLTSQRTAFVVFYNNSREGHFLKVVQK
jgi:hypothetical protein